MESRIRSYAAPLVESYGPRNSGHPSMLVIVPTKYVADQVLSIIVSYQRKSAATVTAIGGSERNLNIADLAKGSDYVVGTPARLSWLYANSHLVTSGLQAVVLEEADTLLTSPIVLDFIKVAVPASARRILCADAIDEWLKDTVTEITRPGCAMEIVSTEVSPESILLASKIKHTYSLVSSADELRQLRFLLDDRSSRKGVVMCRSSAEVSMIAGNPRFADLIALSSDMSSSVHESQIAKFRSRSVGVLVATSNGCRGVDFTEVSFIVNIGIPSTLEQYFSQIGPANCVSEVLSLLRSSEMLRLKKIRQAGLQCQAMRVVSADEMAISFMNRLRKGIMDKDPTLEQPSDQFVNECATLLKLHGGQFLAGLGILAEARKHAFSRKSPLSGLPGFSPILLFDPFMKKIKTVEMAHRLVRDCLVNQGDTRQGKKSVEAGTVGRIALSKKGFVVDLRSEEVNGVIDHKKLRAKNIKAILLTVLPPLVANERLFTLKQTKRDRRRASIP